MELPENDPYFALAQVCIMDNLQCFVHMVRNQGHNIDQDIVWSVCPIGSNYNKRMNLKRTPLMIAAMYQSPNVVRYIVESGFFDVNKPSPSDGATAIECAYDAMSSPDIIEMLLVAQRNQPNNSDRNGSVSNSNVDKLAMFDYSVKSCEKGCRKPDSDMCPYWHEGQDRRRDLRNQFYKGSRCHRFERSNICILGDSCTYAHGDLEAWYHPSLYRTVMGCGSGPGCERRFCSFAHSEEQRRGPKSCAKWMKEEKWRILSGFSATNCIGSNNITVVGPSHPSLVALPPIPSGHYGPYPGTVEANPYTNPNSYINVSYVPEYQQPQIHGAPLMYPPIYAQSMPQLGPRAATFLDDMSSVYNQMGASMYGRQEPNMRMNPSTPVTGGRVVIGPSHPRLVALRPIPTGHYSPYPGTVWANPYTNRNSYINVTAVPVHQRPPIYGAPLMYPPVYSLSMPQLGPRVATFIYDRSSVYNQMGGSMYGRQEPNMMMNTSTRITGGSAVDAGPSSSNQHVYDENTQGQGNATAANDRPSASMEEGHVNATHDDSKSGANLPC